MEVPFEYLCFLALEKLLKYENKRKIKIEKLLKYIDEIQKSFIKSFNNGEKATREKGLKRNFKFKIVPFSFFNNPKKNGIKKEIYLKQYTNIYAIINVIDTVNINLFIFAFILNS